MLRVLVVEDDPDIREVLASSLRRRGHQVTEVRDGQDALDWLAASVAAALPNVILLDLMMPRLDGWAFCERKQDDPRIAAIPVIAMSAFGAHVRVPKVDGFLAKPFEPEQLEAALISAAR